jgi:hypothetical protein
MLANSCTNCLYSFLCGFIFLLNCGSLCTISQTAPFIVYYDYLIWEYFTSSLAILISLIELVMCLQRYSVISHLERFKFKKFFNVFPILVVFSLLTYMPRLFLYGVVKDLNDDYELIETSLSKSFLGIFLDITMSAIRGPLLVICIMIINVLTAFKFASLIKKKRKLRVKHTKTGIIINFQLNLKLYMNLYDFYDFNFI